MNHTIQDICLRQEKCQKLEPNFSSALTSISYVGISVSIVFLILTLIILLKNRWVWTTVKWKTNYKWLNVNELVFRKATKKQHINLFRIQLSFAMLFMLIASLALVVMSIQNVTDPYVGCMTVSVLVHYFTLVAIMWMGAGALLVFVELVFVFYKITSEFVVSISISCWSEFCP